MIVYTSDMPTQGKLNEKVTEINVMPLTFGELLGYLGDEQLTPAREYIRALNYMVKVDQRVADISLLDVDYIMYLFKSLSASKDASLEFKVRCDHCGKVHNLKLHLNEISFKDIDDTLANIQSINIGGKTISLHYTTIGEFIKFISTVGRYNENIDIDVLKLASMLVCTPSESLNILLNAVQDDIALINYLQVSLLKLAEPVEVKCPKNTELRGTTATFSMSAVDIFHDILQSNQVINDKILFGKVS